MTKIVKATSKGQITLPAAWRKQFNTDQFLLNFEENKVIIEPIKITNKATRKQSIKEIIKKEREKGGTMIFDAVRDNKGKGVDIEKVIKVLKEIDG